MKLRLKLLETLLEWKVQATCCCEMPVVVESSQSGLMSIQLPLHRSNLEKASSILALEAGALCPGRGQHGVCDSGRLAQPCEVVRAQLAKGGWSPRPREAWRVGVPVVLRLHLADSAGGDAFSLCLAPGAEGS